MLFDKRNILHTGMICLFILAAISLAGPAQADRLKVIATVPDLGDLVRQVGGEHVEVTVLARGGDDPHFLEARPGFIRAAANADVFIQIGLELEAAWVPLVLRQGRNARVQPQGIGHIDASSVIQPRGRPVGRVDRSRGDVHAGGNPHYLLDPLAGLAAAGLIRDRLTQLRPEQADDFRQRYDAFEKQVHEKLVGPALAADYDASQLARLYEHGRLKDFLASENRLADLGGWLGRLLPFRGRSVVADHNLYPYMAARFGIEVVGFMEPVPGMAPTTRHLRQLVEQMRQQQVDVILCAPYFDGRHARFLAQQTDARIAHMAHQVGGRPGAETYLEMIDYNVQQLVSAMTLGTEQ